jgi:NADH-quinone oxidoreductase subunit M
MVNHGIVVAPLILIIGLLAARADGSEDIRDMGGLAFRAPVLAALFLIVALANLAMPGATNFVGEFYILLGLFNAKLVIAIVAFAGVALAAVYTLRMYIRTMHNRQGPKATSREMSLADGLVLVPLVLVILALSVYPQVALKRSQRTTSASIQPAVSALGARDGTATARTTP